MRFFAIAAAASLIGAVSAALPEEPPASYITSVTTAYTTVCPEPTTVTYGTQSYVVTESTTLTIPDATVTRPIYTKTVTECNECPPVASTGFPVYPNGTAPVPPVAPTSTFPVPPPIHTGSASRAIAGAGAALAGVLGLAIML